MPDLLTAAQMRATEAAAIDSGAVTGLALMEMAGGAVVDAMFAHWPDLAQTGRDTGRDRGRDRGRAVILAGPGNNGGDGFVVARLLHRRGWDVHVYLLGDAARLPADAQENQQRWARLGRTRPFTELPDAPEADVVVDALFGTGLRRPLEADVVRLRDVAMRPADRPPPRSVAVDMPSGLCSDSGRRLGNVRACDLTVTFHTAKPGHYLSDGPDMCGRLVVADIGLPAGRPGRPDILCLSGAPVGLGKEQGHKFSHGHALVLTGGSGRTGAARLAARAALRVGCGLVTLGVPGNAQMEVASQITALMLRRTETAADLASILEDDRINTLCLGPGLGLSDERAALTQTALKSARATVLDADALTLIARDPALFARLHDTCILTPHKGEFGRLFPDIAKRLGAEPMSGPAYSKVDATRAAAARAGCTVLFKGADTVIADPSGRCCINSARYDRAAPWLATAGSGDVLAGIITGLLARGHPPMTAGVNGAWLHVQAARQFGPGLIAEDLPETLPAVFRSLGL